MGAVLIVSGVLKVGKPADLTELENLGLWKPLRKVWLARLHPWAEIILGAAILLLGGVLGILAAAVAVVVMGTYLVLVARTLRDRPGSTCACFGASKPVTRLTVIRNAWLTLIAVLALAVSGRTELWTGPLLALEGADWLWALGLAVAAVTAMLIALPDSSSDDTDDGFELAPTSTSDIGDEELDYLRSRTPAVPVMLADGTTTTLRDLSSQRALMIFAVSHGCGSCQVVFDNLAHWRALLPEVDLRIVLRQHPDSSAATEHEEPQSIHDVEGYLGASFGYRVTPSAILFGADGLLAGGPVSGPGHVSMFVDDVYESLHGERPPQRVPGAH